MASGQAPEGEFDVMIGTAIHGAIQDVELSMAFSERDRGVETESVLELCRNITGQVPAIEADLKSRFADESDDPDHFLAESVLAVVQLAWKYGFRAGRIFEARGYHIPGEGDL